MKKIISLLILLFTITSCYRDWEPIHNGMTCENFWEEFFVGDSISFHSSCNVFRDRAEFYFVRKDIISCKIDTIWVLDHAYLKSRDSVIISREVYQYSKDEFKRVLYEKNNLPRDDDWFPFTPAMHMTWNMFDNIYNTYCVN